MSEHIIYSRFEVTKSDGTTVKLRIQEARLKDIDNVIDFISKYFVYDEQVFVVAAGIASTEDSLNEFCFILKSLLEDPDNTCLLCVIDEEYSDDVKVVGSNVLHLVKTGEKFDLQPNTPQIGKMLEIINEASKTYDVLEQQNVDATLTGAGLSVDPSFRRCGIATKLLEARKPLLLKRSLSMTDAWFTSYGSQKAAKSAGYEEVAELSLEDLGRSCDAVFDASTPPTIKFMILKV